MTNSSTENINAVGGTADGVMTREEIRANTSPPSDSIQGQSAGILRSLEWRYSSNTDVQSSTKYPYNPANVYIGAGAFSMNPLLGTVVFGTSENEPSTPSLKIDKAQSSIQSSMNQTTLGSKNIDTMDGYEENKLMATFPSSFFTPQKNWLMNIFGSFTDKRLYQIAFLELVQVLLLKSLKGTKSEQIVQENKIDLGTIIVDNQEIEDRIINEARL